MEKILRWRRSRDEEDPEMGKILRWKIS